MAQNSIQKKVVLITSGQPSLNPRLVKEADILASSGFDVTVLYAYWNNWGTAYDNDLLSKKKWTAIRVGGDPVQKPFIYFISRIIHKVSGFILQKTGNYKLFADISVARCSYFLVSAAKKHKADLYIAHNLGALPATYKAAKKNGKPFGFDAEDFHRHEISNDTDSYHFKLTCYLENKYLPYASYITASSPLTAEQYGTIYNREVTTLLNVFPKTNITPPADNKHTPLKLFWFSQTIGSGRGLELIIEAMGQSTKLSELHLLGNVSLDYKKQLLLLAENNNIAAKRIYFYDPIKPDAIFGFAAQFDIGLASELTICLNRDISLTNKIFTYVQSGLAVAASNTMAQSAFIYKYPNIGFVYADANGLAAALNKYDGDRELLLKIKTKSFEIGQSELNWERESQKFTSLVEVCLSANNKK
jgi:glycosyltransferase involved in cell wall biosynthesis